MKFDLVCNVFERLSKTSKRLEKVLILRDFFLQNKKEAPLIFDIICGNYQREIDKRSVGISLKTIFSVIGFVGQKSEIEVEKYFNKVGDVGEVAREFLKDKKQSSLSQKSLTFEDILKSLDTISKTVGTNKNKMKKEVLSNLFIYANSEIEYKYLARLLIDDLRIGVSEGVLKEAVVNSLFTGIIGINLLCSKCGASNLNLKKCFICNTELDSSEIKQIELIERKYKILEVDTPKEFIGLDEFIGKIDEVERLKFILRARRDEHFLKTNEPRVLYNLFLELFEKKYDVINSFREVVSNIKEDLINVINCEIVLGIPIKSMLGTRANTVEQSFNISGKPALLDFKYDGLRVQIHNNLGEVKLFSRNLEDITKQFPEVIEFVKDNFSDVSFVVDSECVGFDFDKMQFLPFQMLSRRILTKEVGSVSHIKVVVKAFDLLYFNGETLIDESYSKRREMLDDLFVNKELVQSLSFNVEKID